MDNNALPPRAARRQIDENEPIYQERDHKYSRYTRFGSGTLRCGGPAGDGARMVILLDPSVPENDDTKFIVVRYDEFAERYPLFRMPVKPAPLREDATPAENLEYQAAMVDYEAKERVFQRWNEDDRRVARGPQPVLPENPTPKQKAEYEEQLKRYNQPANSPGSAASPGSTPFAGTAGPEPTHPPGVPAGRGPGAGAPGSELNEKSQGSGSSRFGQESAQPKPDISKPNADKAK